MAFVHASEDEFHRPLGPGEVHRGPGSGTALQQFANLAQQEIRREVVGMDHLDQPERGESFGPNELLQPRLDTRDEHRRFPGGQQLDGRVVPTHRHDSPGRTDETLHVGAELEDAGG